MVLTQQLRMYPLDDPADIGAGIVELLKATFSSSYIPLLEAAVSGEMYVPGPNRRPNTATGKDASLAKDGDASVPENNDAGTGHNGDATADDALELSLSWDNLLVTLLQSLETDEIENWVQLETLCRSGDHDGLDTVIAKGTSRLQQKKV